MSVRAGLVSSRQVRGVVEACEPRRLLAAVSWDGGGDNLTWGDPLNWSNDRVPKDVDDVTLSGPADFRVVISGEAAADSIDADVTLEVRPGAVIGAGSLLLRRDMLLAGRVREGSITAVGGAKVIASTGATLEIVTLRAPLDVPSGRLLIDSGLKLFSTITLGRVGSTASATLGTTGLSTAFVRGSGQIVTAGDASHTIEAAQVDRGITLRGNRLRVLGGPLTTPARLDGRVEAVATPTSPGRLELGSAGRSLIVTGELDSDAAEFVTSGLTIDAGATIRADAGLWTHAGALASAGAITLGPAARLSAASLSTTAGGSLDIELDADSPATSRVTLGGNASLLGTTRASFVDGFDPDLTFAAVLLSTPGTVSAAAGIVAGPTASGFPATVVSRPRVPGGSELVLLVTPRAGALPDLLAASDTGISASDDLTRDATPTVAFAAPDAGFTTYVYEGDALLTSFAGNSDSITLPALAEGTRSIRTRVGDLASGRLGPFSDTLVITIDLTAPRATGLTFEFERQQAIVVEFDEPLGTPLRANDLAVPLESGGFVSVSNVTQTDTRGEFVLDDSRLPDGNYVAALVGSRLRDRAGNLMTLGNSTSFFVLAGDHDRDRDVDFADLVRLAQNYGTSADANFSRGDSNYDGVVDFADLVTLAQRYGTTLAEPAALTAPAPQGTPNRSRRAVRDEVL